MVWLWLIWLICYWLDMILRFSYICDIELERVMTGYMLFTYRCVSLLRWYTILTCWYSDLLIYYFGWLTWYLSIIDLLHLHWVTVSHRAKLVPYFVTGGLLDIYNVNHYCIMWIVIYFQWWLKYRDAQGSLCWWDDPGMLSASVIFRWPGAGRGTCLPDIIK